jgi:TatD DNase family protein
MDYAYRFGEERRLYLNATNRCTNHCSFCVRYKVNGLGGAILWGNEEPDLSMLQEAVLANGALSDFDEFVWCGYGEPTFRLELIKEAAPWLRSCGARIRLNTNGHACLIHGRDVLPELAQSVDEVSISLNAPTCERYLELCRPDSSSQIFWEAMIDFLARAPQYFKETQASVVGHALTEDEVNASRLLASSLGIAKFRVR